MDLGLIMLTAVLMCASNVCARRRNVLRIINGVSDTEGKYPYVVCLLAPYDNILRRTCSGSLITSQWVITAAHCLGPNITHIQYGNMSVFPFKAETVSPILKKIIHPNYNSLTLKNDIAVLHVRSVPIGVFGILSAVYYNTLLGRAVKFAGYGATQKLLKYKVNLAIHILDEKRPLQLGEGVVTSCKSAFDQIPDKCSRGPFMCVTAKCSKNQQLPHSGDSGGPLFFDEKIVGVASWIMGNDISIVAYTPISPFLSWINQVMNS